MPAGAASAPRVCLGMIVKNERRVIERCLRAAQPHLDAWLIVDTGSTDGTQDLIRQLLDGTPGELIERPWVNFGHNRSELVSLLHGRGDWYLLLDADQVLETEASWRQLLSDDQVDAWMVPVVGGDVEYAMPYLVNGHRRWWYEGSTHEYLMTDGPHRRERQQLLKVRHFGDGGSRADKFTRDRDLLEDELRRKPDDPRTLFYLANTYRDLSEKQKAIDLYRRRVAAGGWEEEVFHSQLQVGLLLEDDDWDLASSELLKAWAIRPTRAEALYHLARGWRARNHHAPAYLFADTGLGIPQPEDILFVPTWVYEWGLRFERSVAAWYVGKRDQGQQDAEQLERAGRLPEPWRAQNRQNLALYRRGSPD